MSGSMVAATHHDAQRLQSFTYDDAISRAFLTATLIWAAVATLAGLYVAVLLIVPEAAFGLPQLTFGRLRPLHTNAAIFAFAGNAIFAAIYYSTQRLLRTRMFSDVMSWTHFWGWQGIIVGAALTLPSGMTQGKEYAELIWPLDIAIAVVWVIFAVNFFGTLVVRRERHIYVAIWFYIATIVTVAILHIFNSLALPATWFKSYPVYAGAQDAFMQWWYGHNAVAFFLTTPFLGLMYYFLPKAADRPVFSYRLSMVHFWSLVFIYIWAGPHHLHYTATPEWASTLGMLFSLMLWMPSWGGMINGLLTLRGVWYKVTSDPVLKFFVVGITFYGMATFEGPAMSIKSINALTHYTDWTIGHVHSGALGWNGFMAFGMLYWLAPRLFQTKLWSRSFAEWHFWLGTIGILLYVGAMYVSALTQGSMWRAMDDKGSLVYPEFIETVTRLIPFYWIRALGGALYVAGIVLCAVNYVMTWRTRPAKYEVHLHQAPALTRGYVDPPPPPSRVRGHVLGVAHTMDRWAQGAWHRVWERKPLVFTIWTTVAVVVASLFEIIPTFVIKSNVPTIATVTPYTPLELCGRDIYIAEGCYNCHSQMIRPILSETKRYHNEYSKPGEFVYDRPFQWGSRRIGPDLAREGGKQSSLWHVLHFENPRQVTATSVMPAYPHLLTSRMDAANLPASVRAMQRLGVPYDQQTIEQCVTIAREQGRQIAAEIVEQDGPPTLMIEALCPELLEAISAKGGTSKLEPADKAKLLGAMADTQVVAMVAYLQRLGTDLFKPLPDAASVAQGPSGAADVQP